MSGLELGEWVVSAWELGDGVGLGEWVASGVGAR